MQPIVSGSTTERMVRTSIVTALAVFGSAYCFYDGYVGYPRENLKRAVKELAPQPPALPPLVKELSPTSAEGIERGAPLADVVARWGEPGWRHRDEARYFGPSGQLVLTLSNERVLRTEYQQARFKTELDLQVQKYMGIGVGVAALALLVHWLRVMFGRTRMSDEGVRTAGSPLVPFEAMTGIRADLFAKKGWVDVEYSLNGRSGAMRLDDYKIKAFSAVMEEICRRRGFEDPYKKWQAEKAARSHTPA